MQGRNKRDGKQLLNETGRKEPIQERTIWRCRVSAVIVEPAQHLPQTKRKVGGGKISVGAAVSFDSERKGNFSCFPFDEWKAGHTLHSVHGFRWAAKSGGLSKSRHLLRNKRGWRNKIKTKEEKWKKNVPDIKLAGRNAVQQKAECTCGSFSHCSGFQGVSDCVCQLTMGKCNSYRALLSGTDVFFCCCCCFCVSTAGSTTFTFKTKSLIDYFPTGSVE